MAYGEAVDPINLYRVALIQFAFGRAFKMAMRFGRLSGKAFPGTIVRVPEDRESPGDRSLRVASRRI